MLYQLMPTCLCQIEPCAVTADIVVLLESSQSVTADSWATSKRFAADLFQRLHYSEDTVHFGVVSFASNVVENIDLRDFLDKNEVVKKIEQLPHMNTPGNLTKALVFVADKLIMEEPDREPAPNIVIIVKAGTHLDSRESAVTEAQLMKAKSMRLFTVGFTDSVDTNQLMAIATDPDRLHSFFVQDTNDSYTSVMEDLLSNVCRDVERK
jgi:hypothetical protein